MEKLDNIKIFEEKGYIGTNTNRPKYKEFVKLIKEDKVDNLIVYKIDRVSRSIIDFAKLLKLYIDTDVNLTSVSEGLNLKSKGARLILQILMILAENEILDIKSRTVLGVTGGLEKGIYTLGGITPFVISRNKENKLEYNEDIKIVKDMFDLDEKGHSYTTIEQEINNKYSIAFHKNSVEKY